MIIDSVEVHGFWDNKKACTKFNQDVTILIGRNGTGKTTFVNLIAAVLSVDIVQLSILQFESIKIKLIDRNNKKRVRTINVSRRPYNDNIGLEIYDYKIGNKNYQLLTEPRITNKNNINRARHFLNQTREQHIALKKELSELVQLSQISVYRQSYDQILDADPRQRISAVDERLRQLFERFARYQLKLETRLNEISKKFQQDTVSSLLYNQGFDVFTIDNKKLREINLEKLKKDLYAAFKELGIQDKSQNIEVHLKRIENAINSLHQNQSTNAFDVDDLLALPLIYRTNHIINSLNESEKEKKQMTRSRQNFFQILSDFMPGKEFNYDRNGELSFALIDDKSKYFPWTSLSSGEKQLLIQFLEVLLQESRSVIFIADEPEISLHVTWQENLLSAIRDLNENAQLIIATHSPDIVADFSDKVIDMEEVIAA
jgi:predicted ATPase